MIPDDGTIRPDTYGLRTAHISYEISRSLTIEGDPDGERNFLVLECSGSDPELVGQFLGILETLPLAGMDSAAFDRGVRKVFELFRSLSARGTGTPQGLWAELLLLAIASDPAYLARAWHTEPNELHDFVGDGSRLEVKSTKRAVREHEFSLDQLQHDADATVVASVLLREGDGPNVFDLEHEVLASLADAGLRSRVQSIVRTTLGEGWREAREIRFDLGYATAKLAFYRARDVPTVTMPIPPAVRNVQFASDLSAVNQLSRPTAHTLVTAVSASL